MNEEEIFQKYAGLLKSTAKKMAMSYHCYFQEEDGKPTAYTVNMLQDLESEGRLALLECVHGGRYDPKIAELSTYAMPFVQAAMRRFLETNLGVYALSHRRMSLVRKAQKLYRNGKTISEISAEMGTSENRISQCVHYATHFFSIQDLSQEDEADPLDWLADPSAILPEAALHAKMQAEWLNESFHALSEKEQSILGQLYGVFGYAKMPLSDIAMFHMMKEDGVEKARKRTLSKLRKCYPGSQLELWDWARKAMRAAGKELPAG